MTDKKWISIKKNVVGLSSVLLTKYLKQVTPINYFIFTLASKLNRILMNYIFVCIYVIFLEIGC